MTTDSRTPHEAAVRRALQPAARPVVPSSTGSGDIKTMLLQKLTEGLSARELYVLLRIDGVDGGPVETLEEVGDVLGCSRETVRKQYVRARKHVHDTLPG